MENNTECCICLTDINELYDCDRCINKICEECFIKMLCEIICQLFSRSLKL